MSEIYPEDTKTCPDCGQRFVPSGFGCPFCEERNEGDNRAPAGAQPHSCPACRGTGKVSRPPWIAGDQDTWASNSMGPWPCGPCSGTGVLWSAAPQPQGGAQEREILERAATNWPAESPLHSAADDVAGLLEYGEREHRRGMSGEMNFFYRCASRIANAELAQLAPQPQADRAALVERLARVVEAHPSFVDGRAEAEDLARCIVSRLSSLAEATERPARPPVHVNSRGVSHVEPTELAQSQAWADALANAPKVWRPAQGEG